jgi:hypothetical protein
MDANRDSAVLSLAFKYVVRILCVAGVAWTGTMIAGGARALAIRPMTPGGFVESAGNDSALLPTGEGVWSFVDSGLSVSRHSCNERDLQERLREFSESESNFGRTGYDASRLVALAKANGAVVESCAAGFMLRADQDGMRLHLVVTDLEVEPNLVAVALAMREPETKRWQLVVGRPTSNGNTSLLPLPENAQLICRRESRSGDVQLEFVSTSASAESLLDLWRKEGWKVTDTPWGSASGLSFLCKRDGDSVYAWADFKQAQPTLMLSKVGSLDLSRDAF